MKKFLMLFVSTILIITTCCAGTTAEPDPTATIKAGMNWLFVPVELNDGYFAAGEAPTGDALMDLVVKECTRGELSSFFSDENQYDAYIETDVLEAIMTKYFTEKEVIVAALRQSYFYTASDREGYYHVHTDGKGDQLPAYYYLGYQALDAQAGIYEVYGYRVVGSIGKGDYIPSENEVEGIDYVLVDKIWGYYEEATGIYADYLIKVSTPVLEKAVKAVITIQEKGFAFTSVELIDRSAVPINLIEKKEDSIASVITDTITLTGAASLVTNIKITIQTIQNEAEIASIHTALGETVTDMVVYDISALVNNTGEAISRFNQELEISMKIPEGFTNPAVFYVSDDGQTVERLQASRQGDKLVFATNHLSYYVMADTIFKGIYGDADEDNNINSADALLALQHSVLLTELTGDTFTAADVDRNGQINASDALYILQYSVDLISSLPIVK